MNRFAVVRISVCTQALGILLGVAFAFFGVCERVHAVDTLWSNAGGGQFDHPANWSEGVPTLGDRGIFTQSDSYTVSILSDVDTGALGVLAGEVTLNLNGHALSTEGIGVGFTSGPDVEAKLAVQGGTSSFGQTYVGFEGIGKLVIRDGAHADAGQTFILGYYTGDEGTVDVTGPNSRLTTPVSTIGGGLQLINGQPLTNTGGTGTLNILDGGQVASTQIALGFSGAGLATVSGQDSRWDISEGLGVGYFQNGELNITDGGVVEAPSIVTGGRTGSSGTIHVHGAGSLLRVAGSAEASIGPAGGLQLGGVQGIVDALGPIPDGPGGTANLIVSNSGEVQVSNTLSLWAGATVDASAGGVVRVGNVPSASEGGIHVGNGGVIEGTGTIVGNVINAGGQVSPGFSPGVLTIEGDYTQAAAGSLLLEIGGTGPGQFDQLVVTGNLSLAGVVQIGLLDDFVPEVGDQFQIFAVGGTTDLSGLIYEWLNVPAGFHIDATLLDGTLTITAVPEPSSLILAGTGLILAGVVGLRRRRRAGR